MFVAKVKRVVNPHRAKKKAAKKKTKRIARKANGQFVKKVKRRAKKTSKRRRSNPAQLLTMGFVNPHKPKKRRNTRMATKKARKAHRKSPKRVAAAKKAARTRKRRLMAKSNPVRRYKKRRNPSRKSYTRRRTRRNKTRVIVMAPRRRNGRRRRNPVELFGQHLSAGQAAKMVAAGLVGVTATKLVVPMIPGGLTSTPIGAAIASIVVAIGGGWLIGKWDKSAGNGFAFGGLMQAGSILLSMVPIPGVSQFALSGYRGMGDFVPASFPIPQTPILLTGPSMGAGGAAGAGMSGRRAYARPY
jgi:hypothetical protein